MHKHVFEIKDDFEYYYGKKDSFDDTQSLHNTSSLSESWEDAITENNSKNWDDDADLFCNVFDVWKTKEKNGNSGSGGNSGSNRSGGSGGSSGSYNSGSDNKLFWDSFDVGGTFDDDGGCMYGAYGAYGSYGSYGTSPYNTSSYGQPRKPHPPTPKDAHGCPKCDGPPVMPGDSNLCYKCEIETGWKPGDPSFQKYGACKTFAYQGATYGTYGYAPSYTQPSTTYTQSTTYGSYTQPSTTYKNNNNYNYNVNNTNSGYRGFERYHGNNSNYNNAKTPVETTEDRNANYYNDCNGKYSTSIADLKDKKTKYDIDEKIPILTRWKYI